MLMRVALVLKLTSYHNVDLILHVLLRLCCWWQEHSLEFAALEEKFSLIPNIHLESLELRIFD